MSVPTSRLLRPALAALLALPALAGAQGRGAGRDTVPVSMLPPAGKCRIWMDGVPAAQQPAPTDCATALRTKPANGVVLYGPSPRGGASDRFDPRVAPEPAGRTKPDEGRREDARDSRREQEERQRDAMRAREEQARREAADERRRAGSANEVPRASAPRGGTTTPAGTGTVPAASAPASSRAPGGEPAKPPADPKKKPE